MMCNAPRAKEEWNVADMDAPLLGEGTGTA